jgi:hypothetical protein
MSSSQLGAGSSLCDFDRNLVDGRRSSLSVNQMNNSVVGGSCSRGYFALGSSAGPYFGSIHNKNRNIHRSNLLTFLDNPDSDT